MYMYVWPSHRNGQLIPAKRSWVRFIVAYMTNIAAEINWTKHISDMTCYFILCLAESELTCRPPPRILHGFYSNVQPEYLLNDRVHYHCNTRYYLWGEQTWVCTSVDNIGTWLPGNCLSSAYCAIPPECLLEALFDERCFQKTGNHVKPNNNGLTCPSSPGTVGD